METLCDTRLPRMDIKFLRFSTNYRQFRRKMDPAVDCGTAKRAMRVSITEIVE